MNLKKLVKFLRLGLALVALALAGGTIGRAQKVITVCPSGCDFTSIQAAIVSAPEGSTIQVKAGTYKESLTIFKPLSLVGDGPDKTIIEGGISILATKAVSVTGFAVKGQGIQVQDSLAVLLVNNLIDQSTSDGLSVINSATVTLQGSKIQKSKGSGVAVVLKSRAIISANTIVDNGADGISIIASEADIRGNSIFNNGGCGIRADANSTITGTATLDKTKGNVGGNLCGKAVVLDNEPPTAPIDLTISPSDWTNQPIKVDWTNPDELTSITAAWYKIGSEPTKSDDGWRSDKKPLVLTSPLEGEQPIYLWLEDLQGNKSHQNRRQGTLRFDKTPPTGTLTINDGAKITTSLIVTLKIQAEDKAGDQPGSGLATMRFSNDGQTWSDWEKFQNVRSNWNLSHFGGSASLGPKTVYAQLCDRVGNISRAFTATIYFTGPLTLTGHTGDVNSVAFSPDGKLLASGSWDKTIKLWDVATGREVRTLTGHTGSVYSVAFSPDGKLLASGSGDGTTKLWEVATGSEVRTLRGHIYDVYSVAFSPDGRYLASGSSDKTIKLWEVATGKEVRTLKGHAYDVESVAFSPDGRYLASGSVDKTIKLWDVSDLIGG